MTDTLTETRVDPRFTRLLEVAGERKAELVDGEVHVRSPSGLPHGRASVVILASLLDHEPNVEGEAFGDNVTFLVDLPGRESFSPDVAFHTGPLPDADEGLFDAVHGAPAFAVEVRSKGEYGPRMEAKLARKRDDYFVAGTQVVWDVDLQGPDVVRAYRPDRRTDPVIYRRGEIAEAEPAVPGWRFRVDALFERGRRPRR